MQKIAGNSRLYPELLFDLAQILLGKSEFAKALPYYERYLESSREKDDEYWKTVWLLAWIHYRQDEKEKALDYFRLGSDSPVPGYRIASRYWQGKLENGTAPELDALSVFLLRGQGAGGQGAASRTCTRSSSAASTTRPGGASWRSSRT